MVLNSFSSTAQSIHCHCYHTITNEYTFLSCIYAANAPSLRTDLWEDLLVTKNSMTTVPWLIVGDFNAIIYPEEHSEQTGLSAVDEEFAHCIRSIEVSDCSFSGPLFTWSNKQQAGYIAKKLDRSLVNMEFMSIFPSAHTQFISPGISDHCASITNFGLLTPGAFSPFRFFNFLIKNIHFQQVVEDSWHSSSLFGCKLYIVSKKLKALKPVLRKLNKDYYSNIHQRLEEGSHKLHQLQIDNLTSPHPVILQAELDQTKLVNELALAEEMFLLQKSRIKWLKEGDSNTNFFH